MTRKVALFIDGEQVMAESGVMLGAVMHQQERSFRHSVKRREPRGLYCGMGVCFECVVLVDGQPARACITPVGEGMKVEL